MFLLALDLVTWCFEYPVCCKDLIRSTVHPVQWFPNSCRVIKIQGICLNKCVITSLSYSYYLRNILKLCWVKWWKGHIRKTFLSNRNMVLYRGLYIQILQRKDMCNGKVWESHLWLLVSYFNAQYHITYKSCIASNCVTLTIPYWFNCISLSKQCFKSLSL